MKYSKHLFVLFAFATAVTACKKDPLPEPVANHDANYFPVEAGKYRVYDVDSIKFYDVTLTSDTFHFQIKEEVSELVSNDTLGSDIKSWYEVKIYRRVDTAQTWQHVGYAIQSVSSKTGERINDNLHIVNLNFPVSLNKNWKGNAYLVDSLGAPNNPYWDFTYTTVDTTFSHQGFSFDSTAVVTQYDSQNQITKDIEREAYARGIGLVYKLSMHVERQTVNLMNWIPEKGTIVEFRLREHN
jgi:hypothetical protein